MRIALLSIFFAVGGFAQSEIGGYYGGVGSLEDGISTRYGNIITTDAPFDHSATGTGHVWSLADANVVAASNYNILAPTLEELSAFPGTTKVAVNTITPPGTESRVYFGENSGMVAYTGAQLMGVTLGYSNPGEIGTLPMAFGYAHTDASAGSFTYEAFTGTFTGTVTTTVDAAGTLDVGDGIPMPVTRVKIVQDISLHIGFIDVGTVSQTSYQYFRENDLFPLFSSVTSDINAPLAGIVETITAMELMNAYFLATPEFSLAGQVKLAPNPVNDALQVNFGENVSGLSLKLVDASGRVVLDQPYPAMVNISHLPKGIYFAEIETDAGTVTKKIIKE
jgi:hypothetical protein